MGNREDQAGGSEGPPPGGATGALGAGGTSGGTGGAGGGTGGAGGGDGDGGGVGGSVPETPKSTRGAWDAAARSGSGISKNSSSVKWNERATKFEGNDWT